MKCTKYLSVMLVICMLSYLFMYNLCEASQLNNLSSEEETTVPAGGGNENTTATAENAEGKANKIIRYISNLSGLSDDECKYLVEQSKAKNVDMFVVLGLMKSESNFDSYALGADGERGLGQLMENTARPVALNLGYEYDPNRLYNPRHNIELTIAQLSYLNKIYEANIHKALTAYNRGQKGLEEYIAKGKSSYVKPYMSDYSVKVLNFANQFKEEFEKFQ